MTLWEKMAEIGFYSFIIVMSLFMVVYFGANCYHLATKMRLLLLLLSFFFLVLLNAKLGFRNGWQLIDSENKWRSLDAAAL